jgi:hypothetical protein
LKLDQWRCPMHFDGWVVNAVVLVLFVLVMVVVGLLSRVCSTLCQWLEKCGEGGDWPCRS